MVEHDTIFTVVSRPGPVEQRVLARLGTAATFQRRVGGDVSLRSIETSSQRDANTTRVVLLHGRGHAAPMWAPVITALAPRLPVVAFDLPGFGHSGANPSPPGSAEDGLAFFARPIEGALVDGGPVVLVGHSLGGLVALEIVLRRRVAVTGLVLIDAMGLSPYVTPAARLYLRVGPERLARVANLFNRSVGVSGVAADEDLVALRRELQLVPGGRPLAKRAFDTLVPLFGDCFSRRDRLAEITIPTLLVWGDDDQAFPLPIALEAQARIANAQLEVMAGGHSPHLQHPAALSSRLEQFFDACGATPSFANQPRG